MVLMTPRFRWSLSALPAIYGPPHRNAGRRSAVFYRPELGALEERLVPAQLPQSPLPFAISGPGSYLGGPTSPQPDNVFVRSSWNAVDPGNDDPVYTAPNGLNFN